MDAKKKQELLEALDMAQFRILAAQRLLKANAPDEIMEPAKKQILKSCRELGEVCK